MMMDVPLLVQDYDADNENTKEVVPGDDSPEVKTVGDACDVFVTESKKLWKISVPIVFYILCLYGINSTTQVFAGHIGNIELSAVAIALSVISGFTWGFLIGMGSALETLCGQAFGAGEVEMLGVYLQRSWIILSVTSLLLCPLYLYATPILKLLGQEGAIANAAGLFTMHIIPSMFALAVNVPTQKFLQAQSKVNVMAWMSGTALLSHVSLLWLFIYVFGWGLNGAAAAYNISLWLLALAQTVYVMRWCKEGWRGFSWDAFKGIWAFVRLSLASAVMICLEIWYLMILVLLTGHLNNAEIAVGSISICMNINGWESTMFVGINAAISIRISNELGSGRPRTAMYSVIVVIVTSLAIGLLCMVGVLALRDYFPVMFTSDKEMQRAVSKIAGLLGVTMVLNSIQAVISGVAVGGGWQALVAYINLGCYYVFGLPLGFVFGYLVHWGVKGIWMGMLCGIGLQTLILLLIIWKTNWKDEASQASERVRLWGGQEDTIKLPS